MIIRIAKRRSYSVIPNSVLEDTSLSWEARGMLCYLLSKPDHWEVRVGHLISEGPAGREKVQSILHELEAKNYLTRTREHKPDGTFSWISEIRDDPISTIDGKTVDGSAVDGKAVHI